MRTVKRQASRRRYGFAFPPTSCDGFISGLTVGILLAVVNAFR